MTRPVKQRNDVTMILKWDLRRLRFALDFRSYTSETRNFLLRREIVWSFAVSVKVNANARPL